MKIYKKSIFILLGSLVFISIVKQTGLSQAAGERIINSEKSADQNLFSNSSSGIAFHSLPQNFDFNGVRCIHKDYKGYMWFATVEGLVRFDGIHIHVYENDPEDSTSISHSFANSIVEDSRNNLWIGTPNGLNLYNRDQDNFIRIGSTNENLWRLKSNYVSVLCIDSNDLLWVGTIGDGVNLYDHEKQIIYHYAYDPDNPKSISSQRITSICSDKDGNVWLGAQNGLNLFLNEEEGFKKFKAVAGNSFSLSNNNISCLETDAEGNLWIGTKGGGVNRLIKNGDDFSFKRYVKSLKPGSLSNNQILSLETDNRGNLWIGTDNGGLNRLGIDQDIFTVFKVEEGNNLSISSNSIWSLYYDDEDRLWIGTYNRGVNVIDEKISKFDSYQKNIADKYSLTNNDVKGFSEDDQGNVWVATDGGGICRFNPETRRFDRIIQNSEGNNYLTNNAIQAILFDSKKNLWIGTWAGGIDCLTKTGGEIQNYNLESEDGVGDNNVMCIYEDSEGSIWAGTAGSGLFKLNEATNTFSQILGCDTSGVLTKTAYVSTMLEDSDGNFWIGTLFGLVILQRGPGQEFRCKNITKGENYPSLSSNVILAIYEDSRKNMWFGTGDNGLNLYDKESGKFISFQKKDGLLSNSLRGILEDDNGNIWITTNRGLSKLNHDSLIFTNYTHEDGLNSNEFYERSCLRTRKGEFYLGGENGFNVFYPENIRNNKVAPPVYLSNLKINNKTVEIGGKNSPLKKHISETEEISLNYKQSSFTIEFVALNYTNSSRNQFSYKLDGFEDNWNYAGNRRSATYTNVKPGNYHFYVKGANNDGIWNNIPTQLTIRMKPPYYKSWWAIFIYLLLISILVYFSFKIWNERMKIKHQLKLEQMAREKEHELNEANIQFFTNISHEFRTPLNLIIGPLESILLIAQSKVKEQLKIIYRNAQRLLHLTNNLMDFRKLEEGITSLSVVKGDIVLFAKDVSSYFNVNAKRRNIDFSIQSTEPEIQCWFDSEKMETILLNLLSNAFKYTSDGGKVLVRMNVCTIKELETKAIEMVGLQQSSRYIEIEITDNGLGISSEELPFIFDKFYQSKSQKNKNGTGTGIGLALTKGLVELHHGFITAESIPNHKTCFTVVLPLDRSAFDEDEIADESTSILRRTVLDDVSIYTAERTLNESDVTNENTKDKSNILVVEDNMELRTFLSNELGKEFNVFQAENGEIGIELAKKELPDLIVSDILMPNLSGIELCKAIKADIRTCHIPLILLTAKTTVNDQIEGIEIGADAYITKPFNMKFLFAQVNQIIQSRSKLYAHFSQDVYMMPNKLANNEMDRKFIEKTINYIIQNISESTLNVEGLAVALNLSRSNVYRKIKALTGKTIIEFIRIVRLKQAVKLMETKKYSLAEIAYQTGFTSPSYFTKSFKNQYGKPPSEYLS